MQNLAMDEAKTIAGGYEWTIVVELFQVLVGELTLAGLVDPNLVPTPWVPDWVLNPFIPPPTPEYVEPIVSGIVGVASYDPGFDWDAWLWDFQANQVPQTFEIPSIFPPWWDPYGSWDSAS